MKILLMGYLTDLRKHAISYAEIKKFKVQNIVFKVGTYLRIQHKLTMTDRLIVTWGYNLCLCLSFSITLVYAGDKSPRICRNVK